MEWSDLKTFLAIARSGTLSGAARLTGQTQPTMGRRLRALEAAVDHALFQRTSDGFILTDEGRVVLAHAEQMEEAALTLERRLAGQTQALEGLLRISSSDWFGAHILSPIVAGFRKLHAGVSVELITDSRLFSLARREADLAFRIKPFDEPDVVQRPLMQLDYAVYAAPQLPRPSPGDGTACVLITMDAAFADIPDAQWLRKRLPNARVGFTSNSREAQATQCIAGAGIAVLPCLLADRIPAISRIDLGETPPGRTVYVGYHRDLRHLGRLRAFIDHVFASLPARESDPPDHAADTFLRRP
ncbi:LysR family transcriptional regulator [Azoarcus sp. DD4]|uniref:LysR family transcriptional regulator n=1 Tax=Azoarcus sp. DD4 TaxID=2027405 RepID=UPI00112ED9D4|nr:LysR family transcriptional regulator [Azoarcus sp. DD4]QDF96540.1 LysR family transcriptional regulator [Azoarcus sp. DD4]